MKREIKFRAWCAKDKMMYADVHQGIHFDDGSAYEFRCFLNPPPSDYHEWHLMQFTGLKDKNGKEIYEGDVVRILYTDWGSKSANDPRTLEQYMIDISSRGEVYWLNEHAEYVLRMWSNKYKDYSIESIHHGKHGEIEVIGNIYKNPELLTSSAESTS